MKVDNKDHVKRTKSGIFWSFLNQGGNQVLSLLITFVLARLVSPQEFGLIGMITVFTGFAIRFVDFGFSAALIYKKNVNEEDINTVYTLNTLFGVTFSMLFFAIAPWIASFYEQPILSLLTRSFAIIFIVTGISGVNRALISKGMEFKLNTVITVISLIISSTIAIIMAYMGYGVWSILFKILLQEIINALLYFYFFPVNQKFRFSRESFNSMFSMGRNVAAESTVNYWSRNADNLLIGRMIGSEALGLYSKAYSVMLLPLTNISRVISKVMFPSFSLIQEDLQQIKSLYLKTTKLIGFVTFPLMAGLSLLSELFVLATFGKEWIQMAPLISILSVLGAFQSILSLNGVIYNSLGKSHLAFRITLVFSVINVIGFYLGIKFSGILGLAVVYTTIGIIGTIPNFYFAGKLIKISILEMFKNLTVVVSLTAFMSLCVYFSKSFLQQFELNIYSQLGILIFVGIISYLGLAVVSKSTEYKLIRNLLKIK